MSAANSSALDKLKLSITPVPILKDNYVWVIEEQNTKSAYVVDPGVAAPPLEYLRTNELRLRGVLITHSHWDHIGELSEFLTQVPNCPVYGPFSDRIPQISHPLLEGEVPAQDFALFDGALEVHVWHVPGHLSEHVAYRFSLDGIIRVFSGDILFSAGCGRHFEGKMAELYRSVHSINQLPPETLIYGTHEYTLANLKFAKHVEPDNVEIDVAYNLSEEKREKQCPTLPTTLAIERKINPFLRLHSTQIKQRVQDHTNTSIDDEATLFAELRKWKDHF